MKELHGYQGKTSINGIEYTVSLIVNSDSYDLYLSKPGHAFTYMFGVPKTQALYAAMELGIANAPDYVNDIDNII